MRRCGWSSCSSCSPQEGPCLDCFRTGEPVVNQDLADGQRPLAPISRPVALEAGFQSVHALPMRLRGTVIGAVNLFRAEAGAMDEADIVAGQALADVATIAILQHRPLPRPNSSTTSSTTRSTAAS